jgi:hypothetical protein
MPDGSAEYLSFKPGEEARKPKCRWHAERAMLRGTRHASEVVNLACSFDVGSTFRSEPALILNVQFVKEPSEYRLDRALVRLSWKGLLYRSDTLEEPHGHGTCRAANCGIKVNALTLPEYDFSSRRRASATSDEILSFDFALDAPMRLNTTKRSVPASLHFRGEALHARPR